MKTFDFQPRTKVIFGAGALARLGELSRELGFRKTLIVSDRELVSATDFVRRATSLLEKAGVAVHNFHEFTVNPDSAIVEAGRIFAAGLSVDSIIGLGGGSSLDCAKGINFVLTNGGRMQDYWGYGKAAKPLLPMIGIPTTSGTGSDAQSYALISDAETHVKMACGDPKAAFRVALLDPTLLVSQPASARGPAGYDAISHAVETFVTTKRNAISECYSREAWRLLNANYERVMQAPEDLEAQGAMQIGAHLAGAAIENSMLGATHACANPITQKYGTVHGVAIGLLLSHVVRWNSSAVAERYVELGRIAGLKPGATQTETAEGFALRLEELAKAGGLTTRLRDAAVKKEDFPALTEAAAKQWTGTFNPRPFDAAGAREVYECAW
ncbi:MAG: iron-containing alcohol dehydrogenase [Acidobacteria bacterium]|nr:iron-containing alcohol dehydrogenase [Acidobacteriota bacterium]